MVNLWLTFLGQLLKYLMLTSSLSIQLWGVCIWWLLCLCLSKQNFKYMGIAFFRGFAIKELHFSFVCLRVFCPSKCHTLLTYYILAGWELFFVGDNLLVATMSYGAFSVLLKSTILTVIYLDSWVSSSCPKKVSQRLTISVRKRSTYGVGTSCVCCSSTISKFYPHSSSLHDDIVET